MSNPLNETKFEEHFADVLATGDLYIKRTSHDFDIERLVDRDMLERFLKAQPQTWQRLQARFGAEATNAVIAEYNSRLRRGESLLDILREGIKLHGISVKLVQWKPQLGGTETELYKLYRENRFSVVRQMKYSTAAADKDNKLDLCILINGLPIITCELKNEGTGQNYTHGIRQYRDDRNPQNHMLRTCLVHFVIDNSFAFMTTKLDGEHTRFLPFNQNTTNPPVEGDYPTSYMYRHILQADSLLDILQNFIKTYKEDGHRVVIFPRFHQLRSVRKLRRMVCEEGPGHNYLIEHSAGSGKTKTMAWLAHQLANMTTEDNRPIFDSIIMVTDRIVLNRNMAEDVVNFETKAGTVKDVRKGSKKLADALNDGYRIIISTVQKFAYALPAIHHDRNRKYAIIVDEAHTAIGNESNKDIVAALTSDEELAEATNFRREDYDSDLDAIMAYMQSQRQKMPHLSYFAFTATPKDKTYALFGRNGKAIDLYSMKQAIDEKFILDVLAYYKSYKTMFELIEKNPTDDEQKFFAKKKSIRLINQELGCYPYIMLRKAGIMLDWLMKNTIHKIGGQAKAMLVCDSRRAAADYKRIIDRIIATEYDKDKIKTLVAFSGEVEDSQGRKCTEARLNDEGAADDAIRELFKKPEFKLLIVAEKFQTGFDQPLLHTMFVDKSLGGIQCIQTLSRLNRCYLGKDDTMVIDFRNTEGDVQKAFQRYYTETSLVGEVDTQRIYTMKRDIEYYRIFNDDEVNEVVRYLELTKEVERVPSIMRRIVDDRVEPMDDNRKDKYRKLVGRYVRQYGFFAQFMDFTDHELEKFYVFCKVFYKFLPYTKETLPMEILDLIDLDKLRIQLAFDGHLKLEDEPTELQSPRIGEVGQKKDDEEASVREIIGVLNEPYKGFLNEHDKVLHQILDELLADPEVEQAFNAHNTYDMLINLIKEKFNEKIAEQIDKYYNFEEVLEREQGFTMSLMRRIVDVIARRSAMRHELEYDEEALKEKIAADMDDEFTDLHSMSIRTVGEAVDWMLFVLNHSSLDKLDGIDDILKNTFNRIYCDPDLRPVDKRLNFNVLVSNYEQYLKKLYFIINNEEVEPYHTSSERIHDTEDLPTLRNAIYAFPCLRKIKDVERSPMQLKKWARYLAHIKTWRNETAHSSPVTTEQDVRSATHITMAMYVYATFCNITELESASGDYAETSTQRRDYFLPERPMMGRVAEDVEPYTKSEDNHKDKS